MHWYQNLFIANGPVLDPSYANIPPKLTCDNSQYGTYLECRDCPAGSRAPEGATNDSQCECQDIVETRDKINGGTNYFKRQFHSGQVLQNSGAAFCTWCPAGQEPKGNGEFGCKPCPINKYRGGGGDNSGYCVPCPSGLVSREGQSECTKPCPADKFYDEARDSCRDCPAGSTAPQNSKGLGSCRCVDGVESRSAIPHWNRKQYYKGQAIKQTWSSSCSWCPENQEPKPDGQYGCKPCAWGKIRGSGDDQGGFCVHKMNYYHRYNNMYFYPIETNGDLNNYVNYCKHGKSLGWCEEHEQFKKDCRNQCG